MKIDQVWRRACDERGERLRRSTVQDFWEDFWILLVLVILLGFAK